MARTQGDSEKKNGQIDVLRSCSLRMKKSIFLCLLYNSLSSVSFLGLLRVVLVGVSRSVTALEHMLAGRGAPYNCREFNALGVPTFQCQVESGMALDPQLESPEPYALNGSPPDPSTVL